MTIVNNNRHPATPQLKLIARLRNSNGSSPLPCRVW
jgi:hypothetical protein